MRPGNNIKIVYQFSHYFILYCLFADEKIVSTPLINLNEIKPSFEDVEVENDIFNLGDILKKKKNNKLKNI